MFNRHSAEQKNTVLATGIKFLSSERGIGNKLSKPTGS